MIPTLQLGGLGRGRKADAGDPAGDPYWANVVALLHMDGADGSTTFTDQKGKTWTPRGNAQIDTAQSKFGGASGLFDGTGDSIDTPDHADFNWGSGDFTVEGWIRPNTITGGHYVIAQINAGGYGWLIYQNGSALQLYLSSNGTAWDIASAKAFGTIATGSWNYFAVNRIGNDFTTYLQGVQGAAWSSSASIYDDTGTVEIGQGNLTAGYNGWLDEIRLTKGVGRDISSVPSEAFPNG